MAWQEIIKLDCPVSKTAFKLCPNRWHGHECVHDCSVCVCVIVCVTVCMCAVRVSTL